MAGIIPSPTAGASADPFGAADRSNRLLNLRAGDLAKLAAQQQLAQSQAITADRKALADVVKAGLTNFGDIVPLAGPSFGASLFSGDQARAALFGGQPAVDTSFMSQQSEQQLQGGAADIAETQAEALQRTTGADLNQARAAGERFDISPEGLAARERRAQAVGGPPERTVLMRSPDGQTSLVPVQYGQQLLYQGWTFPGPQGSGEQPVPSSVTPQTAPPASSAVPPPTSTDPQLTSQSEVVANDLLRTFKRALRPSASDSTMFDIIDEEGFVRHQVPRERLDTYIENLRAEIAERQ